jgi:Cyclic nucleotide-binding domain/Major Facilitator Superfamily
VRGLQRSLESLRAVFASHALRNLQLAWLGSIAGEFAYAVALSVFAYRQGGATAVGVVWLVRTLPAAVVAPFAAVLGDRFRRERVMLLGNVFRAGATAATAAAIFWGASAPAVYALSILVAFASTVFWPAQAAVLPALARTPAELTAANTASTTLENVGTFVGPALCGILLAVTSIEAAFVATAAVFAVSAAVLARVHTAEPAPGASSGEAAAIVEELMGGFRAVGHDSGVALLVGIYTAWALAEGALNVLLVVAAIELLGLGEGGVGLLNAAIGVGGLAGAFAALALAGRAGLARFLALGTLAWGVPIALLGVWTEPVAAVVLLGALGVVNIVIDVAGITLLQRVVPDDVRARVFGILEGLWVAGLGLGALAAPATIAVVGDRGALVAWGLFLPVVSLLVWTRLAGLDAVAAPPLRGLELVRGVPFLALLPPPALEQLADMLVPVGVTAGARVVREGEAGDRFYVIAAGEAAVTAGGERLRQLGPGDFFGEIALLHDVPRTASVVAVSDLELEALERADFLVAVTGHAASASEADRVAGARLAGAGVRRLP